jgi:hypothetical protein
MKEKIEADKNEKEMKNLECRIVIQRDRRDLEQEKQEKQKRARSLIKITTRNKEVKGKRYITSIHRHYLFSS